MYGHLLLIMRKVCILNACQSLSHLEALNSGLFSIKQLEVFYSPPDGMIVHVRVNPNATCFENVWRDSFPYFAGHDVEQGQESLIIV